jgi:hypothetical protein
LLCAITGTWNNRSAEAAPAVNRESRILFSPI